MGFVKILRIVFIILIALSFNNTIAQYSKSHYIPPSVPDPSPSPIIKLSNTSSSEV